MVWTEAHNEGAFIATWTSQADPRLINTVANMSSPRGNKTSTPGNDDSGLAGDKPSIDEPRTNDVRGDPVAEKSTHDNKYSNRDNIVHDGINPEMKLLDYNNHTEDTTSVEEDSARTRMGDALYLYQWNLPAHNEDNDSSHNVYSYLAFRCTIRTTSSNSADRFRLPRPILSLVSLLPTLLKGDQSLVALRLMVKSLQASLQISSTAPTQVAGTLKRT